MSHSLPSALNPSISSPTRQDRHVADARTDLDITTDTDTAFAHQFDDIDRLRGRSDGPALNGGSPAPSSSSSSATLEGEYEESVVAAAENGQRDDRDAATRNPTRAHDAILEWLEPSSSRGELMDVDGQASDLPLSMPRNISEISQSTSQRSVTLVEDDDEEEEEEDDDEEEEEDDDDDEEEEEEEEEDDQEEDDQEEADQEENDEEENDQEDDDLLLDEVRAEILRADLEFLAVYAESLRANIEFETLRQEINARLEEGLEILDRLSRLLDLLYARRQGRFFHGR